MSRRIITNFFHQQKQSYSLNAPKIKSCIDSISNTFTPTKNKTNCETLPPKNAGEIHWFNMFKVSCICCCFHLTTHLHLIDKGNILDKSQLDSRDVRSFTVCAPHFQFRTSFFFFIFLLLHLFGLSFFASSQLSAIDMDRRFFDRISNGSSRDRAFDGSDINGGGGGAIADDANLRVSCRSTTLLDQPCAAAKLPS